MEPEYVDREQERDAKMDEILLTLDKIYKALIVLIREGRISP